MKRRKPKQLPLRWVLSLKTKGSDIFGFTSMTALGLRALAADSVEKVGFPKLPEHLFSTLLRKISTRRALRIFRNSISSAYFSTVEIEADFFNRIGQKQSFGRAYELGGGIQSEFFLG